MTTTRKVAAVSPAAGSAGRSWASALLTVDPAAALRRARVAALTREIQGWGSQFAPVLSKAFETWWPFEGPAEFTLRLQLVDPQTGERALELHQSPLRVGRGDACHIQLPSSTVSTEHAEILVDGGTVWLKDLRSTNGTRRNGQVLEANARVALEPGDRVEVGPYKLTFNELDRTPRASVPIQVRASKPRPLETEHPFRLLGHDGDRWARVLWSGREAWVRLPAAWMRACWVRLVETLAELPWEADAMEDGIAQFVLLQVANEAGDALRMPVQVAGWMTTAEAEAVAADRREWLHSDVWTGRPPAEIAVSVLVPIRDDTIPMGERVDVDDLPLPLSICAGIIRLRVADWRGVEPGDALVPDQWLPTGFVPGDLRPGDWGIAYARTGRFWHTGRLRAEDGRLRLCFENLWAQTPGGEFLVAEQDKPSIESESVPIQDLELQLVIELDRIPVTVGEMKSWRVGQCVNLERGPDDLVRLVAETGLQRRVMAEGRVVLVNNKLGIEIVRIVTHLQDGQK
ncbi:MAG: FHA domain-containing protein [Acidobacteria bacterium]|nr:FHA domain-containing protein [Acidobacteriota bacterium]